LRERSSAVGCPSPGPRAMRSLSKKLLTTVCSHPILKRKKLSLGASENISRPYSIFGVLSVEQFQETHSTRMNSQLSLTLWRLSLRQPILSLVVSCFLALQFHAGLCTALSFLARSFSHLSSLVLLSRGSQRFHTFLTCAFNIRCH